MFIIAVVIVVSEFFYFRNIEKGIGRIIEQQEAASNTANTTVENLTVENKISNNSLDLMLFNLILFKILSSSEELIICGTTEILTF